MAADFFFAVTDPDAVTPETSIYRTPSSAVLTAADLRLQGVSCTSRRPCFVKFRGDIYVVGCYSRPVYYPRRDPQWWLTGIKPPDGVLTVVAGTGSGGAVGVALCYITYQHRVGDVLLAESNPSNLVTMTLTGTGRVWAGGLTSPNAERRVTHVAGYASVNGSNYRRAFLAPYGATSIEENLLTNQLTIAGPDGNYLVPAGVHFATEFAQRMWYARTSEHPYRIWRSDPGEPQYVGLANFLDTLDFDDITAIARVQGVLLVFTQKQAYVIRASGTGFQMERLDSSVGCLSHFGCLEVHNKLWFPSEDGYWIYDGAAFRFIMKDMRPYWLADYQANQKDFLELFAVDNKIAKNVMAIIRRPSRGTFEDWTPGTVVYVGNYLNYEPSMGGSNEQPDWSIDVRHRFDYSAFYGFDNNLYFGSSDGKLRVEDATDNNDDGDTLAKPCLIEHGCMLFMEPGDDVEHGKVLHQLWAYVESETTAWSMYVLMGDEWAGNQIQPDNDLNNWKVDVAASALTQLVKDDEGGTQLASFIEETVHHVGPEGIAGRGLVIRVRATSPVGLKYRGIGGAWARGGAPRKAAMVNRFRVTVDGSPIVPNTSAPSERILLAALGGQTFVVTLENADFATYPVAVTYTWSGDHVEVQNDPIAAGLVSPGVVFNLTAGDNLTLLVEVVLGAYTLSKTFYVATS